MNTISYERAGLSDLYCTCSILLKANYQTNEIIANKEHCAKKVEIYKQDH